MSEVMCMYIDTEKYLSYKHIQIKPHMYTHIYIHTHIAFCIHTHRPPFENVLIPEAILA